MPCQKHQADTCTHFNWECVCVYSCVPHIIHGMTPHSRAAGYIIHTPIRNIHERTNLPSTSMGNLWRPPSPLPEKHTHTATRQHRAYKTPCMRTQSLTHSATLWYVTHSANIQATRGSVLSGLCIIVYGRGRVRGERDGIDGMPRDALATKSTKKHHKGSLAWYEYIFTTAWKVKYTAAVGM